MFELLTRKWWVVGLRGLLAVRDRVIQAYEDVMKMTI